MKLKETFIMREIVGEYVLVPVGDTALRFNGIISLNDVGSFIWKELEAEKEREEILADILDEFEVTKEEAEKDMDEFLELLRKNQLID